MERMVTLRASYAGFIIYESGDFSISMWDTLETEELPASIRASKGRKARFSVKGYRLQLLKGVTCILQGSWQASEKGYLNFAAKSSIPVEPDEYDTAGARVAYLSSGLIKGIGKKHALAIEQKFGADSFEVIRDNPELLLGIPGIGMKRMKSIAESYRQTHFIQELHAMIGNDGISLQAAGKIYDVLGTKAGTLIKGNPYLMTIAAGLPFPVVDHVAEKLGASPLMEERFEAAFSHVFALYRRQGHLFLPKAFLLKETGKLLAQRKPEALSGDMLERRLESLIAEKILDDEGDGRIYPAYYADVEKETAGKLIRMKWSALLYDKERYAKTVREFILSQPFCLSAKQIAAITWALVSRVLIITGAPGSGKTTIIKGIVQCWKSLNPKKSLYLLAPTGKAARRASVVTGEPACTVDRMLLMLKDTENKELSDSFRSGLVLCDEMSMVDAVKLHALLSHMGETGQFIMVGDADQLPSIEAGDTLRQMIVSGSIRTICLDAVFRQGEDSLITGNARRINKGEKTLEYGEAFRFMETDTDEETKAVMLELYQRYVKERGFQNVAMLTPRRVKSIIGSDHLNQAVMERLPGRGRGAKHVHANGTDFYVGDRVMENQNSARANNGDVGTIIGIAACSEDDHLKYKVQIRMDGSEEPVVYTESDMASVSPGYCCTIHKSQGSEYPVVIIPVTESCRVMLKRNLLYTGITRAKEQVILVGQKKMLDYAIDNVDTGRRNTMLAEFLKREDTKMEEKKDA